MFTDLIRREKELHADIDIAYASLTPANFFAKHTEIGMLSIKLYRVKQEMQLFASKADNNQRVTVKPAPGITLKIDQNANR